MTEKKAPHLTIVDKEYIWEQKYRPADFDEVILPKSLRAKLNGFLATQNLPSLCLYSPKPGTGKTTTALALAAAVGSKQPLFINASLQTDIANIRETVFNYATGTSLFGGKKIVILDEVERLSRAAQESLKGLMEKVSKNCSFIMTTNNISGIVEPLLSRCTTIQYMWTNDESKEMMAQMCNRSVQILNNEGVEFNPKVIVALVKQHFPDNRSILKRLQEFSMEHGSINEGILTQIKGGALETLIESMRNKKYNEVKQWVSDNATTLGGDFYPRLTRALIGEGETSGLLKAEGVIATVEFLGAEQKDHGKADMWLHVLRVCTVLMLEIENQWK